MVGINRCVVNIFPKHSAILYCYRCLLGHINIFFKICVTVHSWMSASDNHPLTHAPRAPPRQRPPPPPGQHFTVGHI